MSRAALVALLVVSALPAVAQSRIGAAETASGSVSGVVGGRKSPLTAGSAVFQQQVVETGDASSAGLRFNDSTTLAVGASARVTLDRFVYNPDGNAKSAALSLGRGGFRFVTGTSNPSSFKIQTPHATLGIRGTDFTVDIDGQGSDVRLNTGNVQVCTRRGARECAVLSLPGQAIRATFNGLSSLQAAPASAPSAPSIGIGKGKGKGVR